MAALFFQLVLRSSPAPRTDRGEPQPHHTSPFLSALLQGPSAPGAMEAATRAREERRERRRTHNRLVLELIQRYWIVQKAAASSQHQGRHNELGMSMERGQSVDSLSRAASPMGRFEANGKASNLSSMPRNSSTHSLIT